MRRSLVLTDEKARHPFLASLAPHVRAGTEPVKIVRQRPRWWNDLRDFLAAYCACFVAASIYLA